MTLPIERFKEAYSNWRYNPFTAADMAVDASEDGLFIPSGSPFIIQLLELARYNDPTTVSVRCYGVKTDVDQDSGSGQLILYVADTAGFSPADKIIIDRGGAREEERIIDTVQAGESLTVTVNLTYTHTAVQEDDVEKYIAFTETAGAPAQSQFRVDYPPADGEGTGLVEFNQNDADKEVRINYKATGSPILEEYLDTKLSYPAGSPADNQIVGFTSGVPYWLQLPHANLAGVSADQHHPQAHTLASHSTKPHSALTDVTANQHHAQIHTHASHTSIGANDHHAQAHTLASHSSKAHSELTGVSSDQHHPQAHTLASHSSKAHSELTGIGANDHHAQVHTHASHTSIGANDHHPQVHTLGSHSDFGSYLDQAVKTTSDPVFRYPVASILKLKDLSGNHHLNLVCNETLSTTRAINFITGNAIRSITLSGNPTLGDWFDQAVKQASDVIFAGLTLGSAGADAILNAAGNLNLIASGGTGNVVLSAPSSGIPPCDTMVNSSVTFELDETGHNIFFKVRYSDGTQKVGQVSLS